MSFYPTNNDAGMNSEDYEGQSLSGYDSGSASGGTPQQKRRLIDRIKSGVMAGATVQPGMAGMGGSGYNQDPSVQGYSQLGSGLGSLAGAFFNR